MHSMKLFDPTTGWIKEFAPHVFNGEITSVEIIEGISSYMEKKNPDNTFGDRKMILVRGTGKLDKNGKELFDMDRVGRENKTFIVRLNEYNSGYELIIEDLTRHSYTITNSKYYENLGSSLKAKVEK